MTVKNKKTLWIVAAVAVVLVAAVVLALCLKGGGKPTPETSTATTASRVTVTWVKPTQTGTKAAESTTKAAEIHTAPQTTKAVIPALGECFSVGVGGGEFYYAVGYKSGDKTLPELVTEGLYRLENSLKLRELNEKWFAEKIYPRDDRHVTHGTVDKELLKSYKDDGVKIGVLDSNTPVAMFKNGQAVGYEIDVANACFGEFGITPKFVAVTADNVAEKLNSGEVDLVWGGLRDDSVKGIDYSAMNVWNLENEICYYTVGGSRYKGETALLEETEKLGVVEGTLCADFIQDRLKSADYDVKITEFATVRDAFAALKSDTVDCVACDYLSVYAMWKQG